MPSIAREWLTLPVGRGWGSDRCKRFPHRSQPMRGWPRRNSCTNAFVYGSLSPASPRDSLERKRRLRLTTFLSETKNMISTIKLPFLMNTALQRVKYKRLYNATSWQISSNLMLGLSTYNQNPVKNAEVLNPPLFLLLIHLEFLSHIGRNVLIHVESSW